MRIKERRRALQYALFEYRKQLGWYLVDVPFHSLTIYDTFGNLQGVTQERSYSGEEFAQRWDDYTFASDLVLSAGNYILVLWTDVDDLESSGLSLHYDSGATDQGVSQSESYNGNYPDPASFTRNDKKYSIYATYTAAPSATLPSVTTHPVTNIQET